MMEDEKSAMEEIEMFVAEEVAKLQHASSTQVKEFELKFASQQADIRELKSELGKQKQESLEKDKEIDRLKTEVEVHAQRIEHLEKEKNSATCVVTALQAGINAIRDPVDMLIDCAVINSFANIASTPRTLVNVDYVLPVDKTTAHDIDPAVRDHLTPYMTACNSNDRLSREQRAFVRMFVSSHRSEIVNDALARKCIDEGVEKKIWPLEFLPDTQKDFVEYLKESFRNHVKKERVRSQNKERKERLSALVSQKRKSMNT